MKRTNLVKFKSLSKKYIFSLLEEFTYEEIAKRYGTNKEEIRKHVVPFFQKLDLTVIEEFDGVLIGPTTGAWMDSKEKKYNDYLMKNYENRKNY